MKSLNELTGKYFPIILSEKEKLEQPISETLERAIETALKSNDPKYLLLNAKIISDYSRELVGNRIKREYLFAKDLAEFLAHKAYFSTVEKFNLTNVADIKIDLFDYQDLKCIY